MIQPSRGESLRKNRVAIRIMMAQYLSVAVPYFPNGTAVSARRANPHQRASLSQGDVRCTAMREQARGNGPAFSHLYHSFGEVQERPIHVNVRPFTCTPEKIVSDLFPVCCGAAWLRHRVAPRGRRSPCLCHLLATVENGIVASKPQESRPQPPTIRLITGYVSRRCGMLRVNDDTFTMISGLIVIAVGCIAGLLALG
jgi:hypothetical protein